MTFSTQDRFSSELIGEILASIFFGFYVSSATRCSLILWKRFEENHRPHFYLFVTHILLVLLVTMREITGLVIVIAPVLQQEYTHAPTWSLILILAETLWMSTVLVSDAFLCYRTYIVWSRNIYTQILPIILLIGSFATAVARICALADSTLGIQNRTEYYRTLGDTTTAFQVVTLALNAFNTSLIAYRIWNVRRRIPLRIDPSDRLSNLVYVMVHSAAIYTMMNVVVIVMLNVSSSWLLIFQDIQPSFIGIVFTSIIVNVSTDSELDGNGDSSQAFPQRPTEINLQTIVVSRCENTERTITSKASTGGLDLADKNGISNC